MGAICQVLGFLGSSPSTATTALPSMLFMGGFWPPTALLGFKELLESTEGSGDESDLSEEVCLEDSECDDTEEERDESCELQFDESEDGEELLQLLLLLATAWENSKVKINNDNKVQFKSPWNGVVMTSANRYQRSYFIYDVLFYFTAQVQYIPIYTLSCS